MHVDFYILKSTLKENAELYLLCRLIEEAYQKENRVYIHCNHQEEAEQLDEWLWTFKADSFIPHNLVGEGPEPPPPVQIGFLHTPRGFNDILINRANSIPEFASRFNRVIEVVGQTETAKQTSRSHYRDYRAMGCELQTHEVDG